VYAIKTIEGEAAFDFEGLPSKRSCHQIQYLVAAFER
jgi:hypothetical protein